MILANLFLILFFPCYIHSILRYEGDFKCSLCRYIVKEMDYFVGKIDPNKLLEKGSYKLTPEGDQIISKVKYYQSDTLITNTIEKACSDLEVLGQKWHNGIPFFVRTVPKDSDENFNKADVFVGENVTSWLQNQCESFIDDSDNEDALKHAFMNIDRVKLQSSFIKKVQETVCLENLKICNENNIHLNDELDFEDLENLDYKVKVDPDEEEEFTSAEDDGKVSAGEKLYFPATVTDEINKGVEKNLYGSKEKETKYRFPMESDDEENEDDIEDYGTDDPEMLLNPYGKKINKEGLL